MTSLKHQFIQLCLDLDVLKFGEFVTKSGRVSPYFFNSGQFHTGLVLKKLGEFYAQTIQAQAFEFDMAFGAAYKGIPLVCTTVMALAERGYDVPYCFNRKLAKTYGDGGNTVGAVLQGKVLLVDDVITAGTALREAIGLVAEAGASVAGAVVLIDRQEKGTGSDLSAIQSIEQEYGIEVKSIITLADIIDFVRTQEGFKTILPKVEAYREQYGV